MKIQSFSIWKLKGDNEFEKDFGAGTGEAFKALNGGGSSNNRRKRSAVNENAVLKSIFRAKRQAESTSQLAADIEQKEHSMFQRIKEQFNRIIDVAQEMFKKVQQLGVGKIEAERWNRIRMHRFFPFALYCRLECRTFNFVVSVCQLNFKINCKLIVYCLLIFRLKFVSFNFPPAKRGAKISLKRTILLEWCPVSNVHDTNVQNLLHWLVGSLFQNNSNFTFKPLARKNWTNSVRRTQFPVRWKRV